MKVIIAGSRTINDYALVESAIAESGFDITEIVSGGAKGVDRLGECYAYEHGIKKTVMLADWKNLTEPDAVIKENQYGKYDAKAGSRRNEKMAKYVGKDGGLILVHVGSAGSLNMKELAAKSGLRIYERMLNVAEL